LLFIAIAVKVSVGVGKHMPVDHCAGDLALVMVMAYIVIDMCIHHKPHIYLPGIEPGLQR
jgi:hypothetical protein